MIILKKDNHYKNTIIIKDALKLVQSGYEIIKGASILKSAKKNLKPKKKPTKKK